eukprot:1568705-Rhodomonas_salina.1
MTRSPDVTNSELCTPKADAPPLVCGPQLLVMRDRAIVNQPISWYKPTLPMPGSVSCTELLCNWSVTDC